MLRDVVTVWQRSTVAEISWLSSEGPVGIPVVPLLWGEAPCVALPFAHLDAVDSMATQRVVFSVTDARLTAAENAPIAASGVVRTVYDLDGSRFTDDLLRQEVVKYPPTRLRADSLMARREHWWWLPRILITLEEATEVHRPPGRTRAADALLVSDAGGEPRVDVVTAEQWPGTSGSRIELWPRDGTALRGDGRPVFAFGHQHSPDFERWERWHRRGRLHGETLALTDSAGAPQEDPSPFSVFARLRNHRDVQRACRRGIATAESR